MAGKYTVEEISSIISPIVEKYGVEKAYLIGSYADGSARADSDIDIIIEKGAIKGLQFYSCQIALEEALGARVDLLSSKGLSKYFLECIKDKERLIYESKQI